MIGVLKHNLNLKFHQTIENLIYLDAVNPFKVLLCIQAFISILFMDVYRILCLPMRTIAFYYSSHI